MTKALFFQAMAKFFAGVVLVGALLFLPAGTLDYWQARLLMAILFLPMFLAGLVLMWKDPALLQKRLSVHEGEAEQRQVIALSALMFLAAFLSAGLGVRLGWPMLPDWVCYGAAGLFLLSYALYAEVLRENSYLSRTVEVQQGQKVIDTGLYGLVRHPMYTATLALFLSMPLVLGSPVAFCILLCYIPLIRKRIKNEEKVLEEGLEGYPDYEKRVRYRLIPGLW